MPNTVKIMTAVASGERGPEIGDLYESTESNDIVGGGSVYVAAPSHLVYPERQLVLVNLGTGCLHDAPFTTLPRGFRRLPPGTVVTITVEED